MKLPVVKVTQLVWCCMCDAPQTEYLLKISQMCMWHEQAVIEWACHLIFIVDCCHSAKLWGLGTQALKPTKWCYDHDVKAMPDATFTKRACVWCHCKKEGCCCHHLVHVEPNAWCTYCAMNVKLQLLRIALMCMWCKQVVIEWAWFIVSIVACCHCV